LGRALPALELQSYESADAAVMIHRHARWSKESLEHRA